MRFPLIYGACLAIVVSLAACAPQTAEDSSSPSPSPTAGATAQTIPTVAASPSSASSPAVAPTAVAVTAPTATAAAATSPTATPKVSETIRAAASPTAVPEPTISPSPAATISPPPLPPNAPPEIVKLDISSTVVHPGDTVSGDIVTSSNVASVEARIANFSIDVPKVGEGRFALRYTVPNVPFFLRRTYTMDVIARNTAGIQTHRSVPITIR